MYSGKYYNIYAAIFHLNKNQRFNEKKKIVLSTRLSQ